MYILTYTVNANQPILRRCGWSHLFIWHGQIQ